MSKAWSVLNFLLKYFASLLQQDSSQTAMTASPIITTPTMYCALKVSYPYWNAQSTMIMNIAHKMKPTRWIITRNESNLVNCLQVCHIGIIVCQLMSFCAKACLYAASHSMYFKGRNFRGQKLSRVSKIVTFREFKFREFHFMKKIYGKNFRDFMKIFIFGWR